MATTGQAILRQIIGAIRQAGGTVIEVDTDGVFFIPPETVQGEAEERTFVHLSARCSGARYPAGL